MKTRRHRLKVESFRRLLKTFETMTGSHQLGWVLANDSYERLLSGEIEPSGRSVNEGKRFNALRLWWSVLIEDEHPETIKRAKLSYELVTKLVTMLKQGRLQFHA